MVYLTYEQYNKAIKIIDSLTDASGQLTAAALIEIPVIGPIIGELIGVGLGKILAWGLKKILYLIPHANEPRPQAFDFLPLYDPKNPPAVLPPNFKPLNTKEKIKDAIMDLAEKSEVNVPAAPLLPYLQPVQQLDNWDVGPVVVPIYDDGKNYIPGVQKINYYRKNPINPTFDHPGF